ncbi:MAG TPA: NAD(P)-dependent oxidoreductase [Gammaproteobacteria bacterium]
MRVLVAGGAGYIGSVVTRRLLRAGYGVTVLDCLLFGDEGVAELAGQDGYRLFAGDLLDRELLREAMAGSRAVVLLAGIVGEPACNRAPETARAVNFRGALQTLEVAREVGVERFVFASTCSNYGISDPSGLATESSPLRPLSVYAETKVAAEREILAASGPAFCPVVLRFSTAFGVSPRMRFDLLISDFTLSAFREGRIVIFGEQFWRPFVHVEDIAAAVGLVLEAPARCACGEVFNIGSNVSNLRKIDVARAVQREIPGTTLEFVEQGTDPRSYRVDFTKAAEQLGFNATRTVADGVREVAAGLRAGAWPDPGSAKYRN